MMNLFLNNKQNKNKNLVRIKKKIKNRFFFSVIKKVTKKMKVNYIISPESASFTLKPPPKSTIEYLKNRIIQDKPNTKNQIFRFVSNGLFLHESTSLDTIAKNHHPIIVSILLPIKLEIDSKIIPFNVYGNNRVSDLQAIVKTQSPQHVNDLITFKYESKELNLGGKIIDSIKPNSIISCCFKPQKVKTEYDIEREKQREKEKEKDKKVQQLVEKGFPIREAKAALFIAEDDQGKAAELLDSGYINDIVSQINGTKTLLTGDTTLINVALFLEPDLAFEAMVEYYQMDHNPESVLYAPSFVKEHFGDGLNVDWETFYLKACQAGMIEYGEYGDLLLISDFEDKKWLYSFIIKGSKLEKKETIFHKPCTFLNLTLPDLPLENIDFEDIKHNLLFDGFIKESELPDIDKDIEECRQKEELEVNNYYDSYYHTEDENEDEYSDDDDFFRQRAHHLGDDGERGERGLSFLRSLLSLLSDHY